MKLYKVEVYVDEVGDALFFAHTVTAAKAAQMAESCRQEGKAFRVSVEEQVGDVAVYTIEPSARRARTRTQTADQP